jgi:hypothetical protein
LPSTPTNRDRHPQSHRARHPTTSSQITQRRVINIETAHRSNIFYTRIFGPLFELVTPAHSRLSQRWPAERASPRAARAPAVRLLALKAPRSSRAIPRAPVCRYVLSLPILLCIHWAPKNNTSRLCTRTPATTRVSTFPSSLVLYLCARRQVRPPSLPITSPRA